MESNTQERAQGCIVGAAIGDALGMPLEFGQPSPEGQLVRAMQPGRLPAGSFTDDTEMALALAHSYLTAYPLNPNNMADQFLTWYQANPPDIGIQTSQALRQYAANHHWQLTRQWLESNRADAAGNGSVMRSFPAALANWNNLSQLIEESQLQSFITHPHADCVSGSAFVNSWIYAGLHGMTLQNGFEFALSKAQLAPDFEQLLRAAATLPRRQLKNSGWVRHTLQSVVWGLLTTHTYEDALVQIVNLGNDADTAGAVAGAIAGAAYGINTIPPAWLAGVHGEYPLGSGKIWYAQDLTKTADQLLQLSA